MTVLKYVFKSRSPAMLCFAFRHQGIRGSSLPGSAFILTRGPLGTESTRCINYRANPVNEAQFCSMSGVNVVFQFNGRLCFLAEL